MNVAFLMVITFSGSLRLCAPRLEPGFHMIANDRTQSQFAKNHVVCRRFPGSLNRNCKTILNKQNVTPIQGVPFWFATIPFVTSSKVAQFYPCICHRYLKFLSNFSPVIFAFAFILTVFIVLCRCNTGGHLFSTTSLLTLLCLLLVARVDYNSERYKKNKQLETDA